MRLKWLFLMCASVLILAASCFVYAFSGDDITEKASSAIYNRCVESTKDEALTSAQVDQLCGITIHSYMKLAGSEDVLDAAANDFKEGASALVFEICLKIALQEFNNKTKSP